MPTPPPPAYRDRLIWLALLAVSAVALSPVWSVTLVPLTDYGSHLARMYILANLEYSPQLQDIYWIDWGVVPNLVMDLMVPPLTGVVSVFTAGKLFVSAIIVLWVVGPMVLHYVLFGRPSLWPLAAGFFAYNESLSHGLVNYSFAAGLYFFVLAAWMATEAWRPLPRLLLGSVLSLLLFFCHLYAVALYGLTITVLEVSHLLQRKTGPAADAGSLTPSHLAARWGVAFGQFAAAAALLLLFSPTRTFMAESVDAGSFLGLVVGDWRLRLIMLRSPVWIDLGLLDYFILLVVALSFGLALLCRALRFHRAMVPVLMVLAAVIILMPAGILGEGGLLFRFPPVLAALAFAASQIDPAVRRFPVKAVLVLCAALFVLRTGLMIERWQGIDRQFAEFRAALVAIDRGSTFLPVLSEAAPRDPLRLSGEIPQKLLWHLGEIAIIERDAFVPYLFSVPGQQIVQLKGRYGLIAPQKSPPLDFNTLRRLAAADEVPPHPLACWPQNFDYLAVFHPSGWGNPLPERLEPVHAGSFFTFYRIVPPGGAAGAQEPCPVALSHGAAWSRSSSLPAG